MLNPAKRLKPNNLTQELSAKWDEAEATLNTIEAGAAKAKEPKPEEGTCLIKRRDPVSAAALMSPYPEDGPFKFGEEPTRPYPVGTILYHWIASDLLNQRSAVVQDDGGCRIKIRHDGTQGLCFDGEVEVCAEHARPTPWSEDNPPVPYSSNFPARGRTSESYLTDEQREVLKRSEEKEEAERREEEEAGEEAEREDV